MVEIVKDSVFFFIPGFLGSELHGKKGKEDEYIWGSNGARNLNMMVLSPEKLTLNKINNNVVVGPVLRSVSGLFKDKIVYGDLIDFLCSKEGLWLMLGDNFFVFPYDWREDIFISAENFCEYILSVVKDKKEKNIIIISHSLGGLITRVMISKNHQILNNIVKHIQIASPVDGSAVAYKALRGFPDLNMTIPNCLISTTQKLPRRQKNKIKNIFQGFYSVFQSLPPEEEKILLNDNYSNSALDKSVWKNKDRYIDLAKKARTIISNNDHAIDTVCIYSAKYSTDSSYYVSKRYKINAINVKNGDNTVLSNSACAYSEFDNCCEIDNGDCDHVSICSNPDLFNKILEVCNG
ncbi:MAG: hypothetical protein FDX30_06460 [Chlorobium sp.]|nr:MAG: hypothetical protein FDX30_06460 [Chlorobium sp.]